MWRTYCSSVVITSLAKSIVLIEIVMTMNQATNISKLRQYLPLKLAFKKCTKIYSNVDATYSHLNTYIFVKTISFSTSISTSNFEITLNVTSCTVLKIRVKLGRATVRIGLDMPMVIVFVYTFFGLSCIRSSEFSTLQKTSQTECLTPLCVEFLILVYNRLMISKIRNRK